MNKYIELLFNLLPKGVAWNKNPNSFLSQLMDGISQEMNRVDQKTEALLLEMDPRTSNELLTDWERMLGLPDECTGEAATVQARRNEAYAKLTGIGSTSRQFYIDLAASLGFEVTITEFRPFRAGLSRAGDRITNGDWIYAWQVNAPATEYLRFRAGLSFAGEPLVYSGNDTLQCAIDKRKPAHTIVLFAFTT